MKRLSCILIAISLLTPLYAFANSKNNVTVFGINASLTIYPNDGFGDNVYGSLTGPNVNLLISGGTATGWFDDDLPFSPGSLGGGAVTIYWDGLNGTAFGQNLTNGNVYETNLNAGYFTFPTNGEANFTVTVAAQLTTFQIYCADGNQCGTYSIFINTKPGTLTLSFVYSGGYYWPNWATFNSGSGSTVPEPASLSLMAIGLGMTAWRGRRRKSTRDAVVRNAG